MNSVGRAYGILRGRLTGDREEAKKFLEGLSPQQRRARNRSETRNRSYRKKYKMGSKY